MGREERQYIHVPRLVRARSGHILAERRNTDEVDAEVLSETADANKE